MANIYLTGYRATGKTSTGKALAGKLGISFIDADEELVRIEGRTVAEMVADKGWDYFRDRESDVLKQISLLESCVVATGGGVILRPENIDVMQKTGRVIWLKAGIETIAARMTGDGMTAHQRPSLSGKGVIDEIRDVLEQRLPLYEKAAQLVIDTDGKNPEEVCDEIYIKIR
ncbi:shikimate kinase AroL [Desulforegula conservatrix]|uniref:shikimate kinase AroL n=1 Tax=Desulforegula conservatrix TaxID=153026 RepID=UPI0003F5DB01|nr:shikimate kinase AroL [Desulforegula conservatrix]